MQTFRITYIDAFGRRNLNSHNFESIKYQSLYHYNKNLQLLKYTYAKIKSCKPFALHILMPSGEEI